MGRKPDPELEWRPSRRLRPYVIVFVVSLILALLVSLPLVPLFALYVVVSSLAGALGDGIGLLWLLWLHLQWIVFLTYALLAGEWGLLIRSLPEWLDWLRSVGLL
jgi:hypothetical protein